MTPTKRKVAGPAAVTAAIAVFIGAAIALSQHDRGPTSTSSSDAAVTAAPAQSGKTGPALARKPGDKPLWRSLTPAQQQALLPLQGEWDQMDGLRKQKWLQLANRFGTLKPEEQQRLQERMRLWAKLTPEQRDLARETYTRTRKITPDQKAASWETYLQLPEEQKKKLAASSAARKAPTVVSTQANGKVVAPLGAGATSCPAGMVKNALSATPPCVPSMPAVPAPQAPNPAAPAPVQTPPPNPPQQEKPVPSNWGITPNNA